MNKPLFSVIIPVYNVEQYLEACVDSVLASTYENLEIILVDDGSTDGSGEICDRYVDRDSRISVIHKVNGGLSSARNAGLDVIHGDFVSFVDSDDCVAVGLYETMVQKFERYDVDMVVFGYSSFVDKPSRGKNVVVATTDIVYNRRDSLKFCVYKGVSACMKVYRREVFDSVRFKVGVLAEDAYVLPSVIANIRTCLFTGYVGYFYRKNPDSITHRKYRPEDIDIILSTFRLVRIAMRNRSDLSQVSGYRMGIVFGQYIEKWANNSIADYFRFSGDLERVRRIYRFMLPHIQGNSLVSDKRQKAIRLFVASPFVWYCVNLAEVFKSRFIEQK